MYVHRYNTTAKISVLVARLSLGQTFNDFNADFFVTVAALDEVAGTARLSMAFCTRRTPTAGAAMPSPLSIVTPGAPEFAPGLLAFPFPLALSNNDAFCAPSVMTAVMRPVAGSLPLPLLSCNRVGVIIRPDLNPLEISYEVKNAGATGSPPPSPARACVPAGVRWGVCGGACACWCALGRVRWVCGASPTCMHRSTTVS